MNRTGRTIPNEAELRGYLDSLSNWGRWGAADQLGTLNFITDSRIANAAKLVSSGLRVPLGLPFSYVDELTTTDAHELAFWDSPLPAHVMLRSADDHDPASEERHYTADSFLIKPHGHSVTHLDAPSHTVRRGAIFNGLPASRITSRGADVGAIDLISAGVSGRGVLLDIPQSQGREALAESEPVFPEDLEAAERHHGVHVGTGDILILRTGYRLANPHGSRTRPGMHAACLPWLFEREVAMLASDAAVDQFPHGYESFGKLGHPIHTVGMWAMGLWLIDNCSVEELGRACAAASRYEFFFCVMPLRLTGGTGSPVNPLALF